MDPRSLSLALRRIAAGIDNSKSPSRELVARDLRGLIYRISSNLEIEPGDNNLKIKSGDKLIASLKRPIYKRYGDNLRAD